MALVLNRLKAVHLKAPKPGLHADGGGLYLRVTAGKKSGQRWVFIYRRPTDGKRCELGLGGSAKVPLAKARDLARQNREALAAGRDPRVVRDATSSVAADVVQRPTFGAVAEKYVATMSGGWKSEKHRAQWSTTLKTHAAQLQSVPVDELSTDHVLAVLNPIWSKIPETADRLRGRIEVILDAAKASNLRTGENPARWRGHLKHMLPPRVKLSRGHFARMGLEALPRFMAALQTQSGVAPLCLQFLILTACRSGEALKARWDEIDLERKVWSIPASRMKSGRQHDVPLSPAAIEVLRQLKLMRSHSGWVFPGERSGKPMSDMSLSMVLRRMQVTDATVHGFRSCFRDWAGNHTDYPRELAEHALAHVIGDKAEQAYRRDTAIERRRPMMEDWAAYLSMQES